MDSPYGNPALSRAPERTHGTRVPERIPERTCRNAVFVRSFLHRRLGNSVPERTFPGTRILGANRVPERSVVGTRCSDNTRDDSCDFGRPAGPIAVIAAPWTVGPQCHECRNCCHDRNIRNARAPAPLNLLGRPPINPERAQNAHGTRLERTLVDQHA